MSQLSARLDMPVNRPDAPRYARRAARMLLEGWGYHDPHWLDDAELVISELVTNAVRHGGGLIELRLEAHEEAIVVSAADGSSVVPRRRTAAGGPGDDGGRGIAIIEEFADAWGVENHEGGKRVWVRLAALPGEFPYSTQAAYTATRPETDLETRPEMRYEVRPETRYETRSESRPKSRYETRPEMRPEARYETRPAETRSEPDGEARRGDVTSPGQLPGKPEGHVGRSVRRSA